MKRCIVHIPFTPDPVDRPSMTNIRPGKMLQAFSDIGYEPLVIMGSSNERAEAIREAKRMIASGVVFDFLYSESDTGPLVLTDCDHIPRHPFQDFSFLRYCRRHGVPVGLFYRDAHWRSKDLVNIQQGAKGLLLRLLHEYDLIQYNASIDTLFVPSFQFNILLGNNFREKNKIKLPPGCDQPSCSIDERNDGIERKSKKVNIIYAGGISEGGVYDISLLIEAVGHMHDVALTLCVRKYDWDQVREYYEPRLISNVRVVHAEGEELLDLYRTADIGAMYFLPSEYQSLSMPGKLFSYLGARLPVVVNKGTAAAKFVDANECGWVIDYNLDAIIALLKKLSKDTGEIDSKALNSEKAAKENSWASRAASVAQVLSQVSQ